ncbi:MAG TPA: sugar-binding domain-containing protein [Thermoguttaceae bacterium]
MAKKKTEINPDAVYLVAKLFFDGVPIKNIAKKVNDLIKLPKPLTRESIYPLLAHSRRLRYSRLVPPLEEALSQKIAEAYKCNQEHITVVRTPAKELNAVVAHKAAIIALKLIRQTAAETLDGFVGLGLGPGRATLDFCQYLGEMLRSEIDVPKLKLFAISAGCPARLPEFSSTSFFNLFPRNIVEERIGLFAETLVPCHYFEELKKHPGIAEAYDNRHEINIIITSMGDFEDQDDLLSMFLNQAGVDLDSLCAQGWIGSVQYRPFSAQGPIQEGENDKRAVTLFELEDFAKMAITKNKHVILIARQCGSCGKTRARALRPLLEVPSLRLWSDLVMDEATARELLQDSAEIKAA